MPDYLWFSSPDAALAQYDRSGLKIFLRILRAYDAGEFTGWEHKILPIIEKEAEQEHSFAQRALSEAFLYGRGKPEDLQQAIFWLEKAVVPKAHEVRVDFYDGSSSGRLEFFMTAVVPIQ